MIFALWQRFLGLPRGWHYLAGAIALALVVLVWHRIGVGRAVRADREQAGTVALTEARRADEAAQGQIEATRTEVERTNDEARTAASGSDDPLGSALERLRTAKAGPGTPAR